MYPRLVIFIFTPVLLFSCASDPTSALSKISADLNHTNRSAGFSSAPSLKGSVTREQAIRHAITYSPSLQSQRAELRALEAEIVQAGLPPNPDLGLDVENFAGNGGSRGFNGAEVTAALSQRLELGGKRPKRTLVAALEAESLRSEIASEERRIRMEADRAFTTLVEAREIREFNERNVIRAEEYLGALDTLLEVGKGNRIDAGRAKLSVSEAKELLAEARAAETSAASDLGQIWGGGTADVTASGTLGNPGGSIPTNLEAAIERHPAMRAAAYRFAKAQAVYDLEKSGRYPDVELEGGIRELRDANETAAVVGIRVPLPIFDRNQGNIQAAKERLDRAKEEGRSTASELRSSLTKFSAELRAARSRAAEFDSRTLSAASQALEDTREAYDAGKASLLEVLDARETLFDVERGQVRAKADLLRAHNSLQLMTND